MNNETVPAQSNPADIRPPDTALGGERHKERPFILAVTRNGHMSEHVMDYALNVAHRMQYNLLAVHVDTLPFFCDRGKRSKLFAAAMRESEQVFQGKARTRDVTVEHLAELGKISGVINRMCHAKKRIEFVIIDKGIRLAEVAKGAPVPVFPVITTRSGRSSQTIFHTTPKKGVFAMSAITTTHHIKNCIVFGALNAGLYAAVFANQDVVMKYFAKGGAYALLPVATVFAVSYLHGNFTSSFWSALGIEASKKTVEKRREAEPKVVAPRPDPRPRAQVNV
jgi:hypothetical protein